MPMPNSLKQVGGRTLLLSLVTSVVLFVIAAPLGDHSHGIGKHHPAVADLGNVVFVAFIVSVFVLVALVLTYLVQTLMQSRRHA